MEISQLLNLAYRAKRVGMPDERIAALFSDEEEKRSGTIRQCIALATREEEHDRKMLELAKRLGAPVGLARWIGGDDHRLRQLAIYFLQSAEKLQDAQISSKIEELMEKLGSEKPSITPTGDSKPLSLATRRPTRKGSASRRHKKGGKPPKSADQPKDKKKQK